MIHETPERHGDSAFNTRVFKSVGESFRMPTVIVHGTQSGKEEDRFLSNLMGISLYKFQVPITFLRKGEGLNELIPQLDILILQETWK